MVFVVFGNAPIPFLRLAKKIVEISERLNEEIFVQTGYTDFPFCNVKHDKFLNHSTMREYLGKAEIVVSHGGYGTISEAVKMGKKVVAVPRFEGEHNLSQLELVQAMEKEGYLLGVYEVADLEKKIAEARFFMPREFETGNAGEIINKFILENFSQ